MLATIPCFVYPALEFHPDLCQSPLNPCRGQRQIVLELGDFVEVAPDFHCPGCHFACRRQGNVQADSKLESRKEREATTHDAGLS